MGKRKSAASQGEENRKRNRRGEQQNNNESASEDVSRFFYESFFLNFPSFTRIVCEIFWFDNFDNRMEVKTVRVLIYLQNSVKH